MFGLRNISWLTKRQCCANSNGRHVGGLISLSTSEFCPWIFFFIRQHCIVFHLVKSSECFAIHFRRIRCSTVQMNWFRRGHIRQVLDHFLGIFRLAGAGLSRAQNGLVFARQVLAICREHTSNRKELNEYIRRSSMPNLITRPISTRKPVSK